MSGSWNLFWGAVYLGLFAVSVVGIFSSVAGAVANKAGFSRWYGLLMIIPVINVIVLYLFAYNTWPVEKRRQQKS